MAVTFNVIVSGASYSGALDVSRTPLTVNLGNSDNVGQTTFALANADGSQSAVLFSGHALFQVDAMQGNTVLKTVFRGTLESASPIVDIISKDGNQTQFVGYDLAQELLGLVSPDARQPSPIDSSGKISLVAGDQGMGIITGMDLALYVSGAIGSGTVGYPVGGYTLGKPLAASLSAFMSQYFGQSGDTTGSASGQSFSFKPYSSGIAIWGSNPYYKAWYAPDYNSSGTDTNSNYWITYHSLIAKQEVAWDVLKKITRQGYAIDRSGTKTAFELYVGVSGDLHMRTSGATDFVASGVSLVYYSPGSSGSQNNNVEEIRGLPWDSTNIKNYIVGWFPTWTQFPFSDDYSDVVSYSGAYWSGYSVKGAIVTLSGAPPAPGAPGFISLMGKAYASGGGGPDIQLVFTLWSGYTIDVTKWNVSGGGGVVLSYALQASLDGPNTAGQYRGVALYDLSGNYIMKSGTGNQLPVSLVSNSGWASIADVIYTSSGTFYSGTGNDGGWAFSASKPDLTNIKKFGFSFTNEGSILTSIATIAIDQLQFQFVYNFNPLVAYSQASISGYGRRYEVFQFPYQYTDSGAQAVVTSELLGKMFSRQLGTFVVKDSPGQPVSAQLGIVPGQAFVLDAPTLAAGSGQFYYYFVATSVVHQWDLTRGFITTIQAYPFFSGMGVLSGQNLITYSLTKPMQVQPQVATMMPNTSWWGPAIAGHPGR